MRDGLQSGGSRIIYIYRLVSCNNKIYINIKMYNIIILELNIILIWKMVINHDIFNLV
jgi:hypothetical protein